MRARSWGVHVGRAVPLRRGARKAAWEEVKAEDKAKAKAQAELLERLEKEKSPEDKENEREDINMEDHRHAVLDMARARENNWEMFERFLEEGKGPGQGEGPGQGDGGNMSNEDGGTRPAAGYPGFVRSRPSRPWAYGVMYPWAKRPRGPTPSVGAASSSDDRGPATIPAPSATLPGLHTATGVSEAALHELS